MSTIWNRQLDRPFKPGARSETRPLRVALLLPPLVLLACAVGVNPRFVPSGSLSSELGRGQRLKLEVIDKRRDKTSLGTGGSIPATYKLARPAEEVIDEAFREALSDAGYQVSDEGEVLYTVEVRDFSSAFSEAPNPFAPNAWTSVVSLEVRVRRDGATVATRYFKEESEAEAARITGSFTDSQVADTASAALTLAVEKAVGDPKLARAINPRGRVEPVQVASKAPVERYESLYRRRIATVIGVNDYAHWPKLEGAVPDARRVAESLRRRGFDEVIEIYDGEATRERILRTLGVELPRKTRNEDLAVIFFAGHGQTETLPNGEKRGYVIPVDGAADSAFATAISMDQLRSLSNRMEAKHVYYVMDSCYSGLGFVRGIRPIEKTSDYVQKVTSYRAVQMITAGQEGEMVSERGGRGIFTTYWLRALEGEADFDGDGYVTANEIGAYVPGEVTNSTRSRQTPLFGTLEGNGQVVFPVR